MSAEHQAIVQRTKLDSFVAAVLPPDRRAALAAALPSHIPIDRFERNLHNVLMASPELLACEPRLVYREVSKLAALGLYCDPQLGEAAIFASWNNKTKKKDTPQARIQYKGLLKLARQSGDVALLYAHDVCERDRIKVVLGAEKRLEHEPDSFGDRGKVVGVYAVVKYKSGETDFETMSVADVNAIRDRSDAWKAFSKGLIKSTPWSTDPVEMAKKTVLRRLCKRLPQSPDLAEAWKIDDAEHEPRPMRDISPAAPATPEPRREEFVAAIEDEPPVTDVEPAAEPDAPGWFLCDGDGVQIGEHGSAVEWLAEFDRNAPAATKKAERTAYYTANAETARAIYADADTPEGLVAALEQRFGIGKQEVAS